jgi:hypothetical protein
MRRRVHNDLWRDPSHERRDGFGLGKIGAILARRIKIARHEIAERLQTALQLPTHLPVAAEQENLH